MWPSAASIRAVVQASPRFFRHLSHSPCLLAREPVCKPFARIVSPFAMSVGQRVCIFAMIVSPTRHVSASPCQTFCKPLQVLREATWETRLTAEDLRALTPLIYGHVSPYGHFLLDMQTRLDIEPPLDAGYEMDTASMAQETRSSVPVPRSISTPAQQLALFNRLS